MAVLKGLNRRFLLILIVAMLGVIYFIIRNQTPQKAPHTTAQAFLDRVMKASGGQENYNNIQRITFTKDFNLYTQDASVALSRSELHSYNYSTGTHRTIRWRQDSTTYNLLQRDTSLFQTQNGHIDTTITKTQLQAKLNAATFVLGLPYTLDQKGSTKKYLGITHFEKKEAHELEVTFAHSQDVWRLYYSLHTLDWLGYWVQTSDHYSLVINEEMIAIKGFKLPRNRKSYRTDAQKKKRYLRANYLYDNYNID